MASDNFDFGGFSSNIISDFGPILSLFGEQVAKQFMSQSMGWADHIIFAMAPLGIITALVGAIRVGGSSWMKALIGRARESRAMVEVELMSSTSCEVCEMWDGQNLVRILGSPEIWELIHITPAGGNDDRSNSGEIWTINEHLEGNPIKGRENNKQTDVKQDTGTDTEGASEPAKVHGKIAPNIFLNIHSPVSEWELNLVALVAVVLQVGVLVYACCVTYSSTLKSRIGSGTSPVWSLYCILIGTVSLVFGMLGCCYIIEKASVEQTHDLTGGKGRILWLQKGETVNDQVFNSYAIFTKTPRLHVLTSRRDQRLSNDGIESDFFATATIAATLFSIAGFIVQFMGIRGMHWTVAVGQIGTTIGMAFLRAFLRRSLSEAPHAQQLPAGHEMDWLATRILDPVHQAKLWRGNHAPDLPRQRSWRKPLGGVTLKVLPKDSFWEGKCYDWKMISGAGCGRYEERAENQINRAQQVVETRKRLGYLTRWPGAFSEIATSVAAAIQLVLNTEGFGILNGIEWSLGVGENTNLVFNIELEEESRKYIVDIAAIEAALSLWMFSLYEDEASTAGSEDWEDMKGKWLTRDSNSDTQFIQLLGPGGPSVRRDMAWWAGPAFGALFEIDLTNPNCDRSQSVKIWPGDPVIVGSAGNTIPGGQYAFRSLASIALVEDVPQDDNKRMGVIYVVTPQSPHVPPAKEPTSCLMRVWEGSKPKLFAHEMFTSFMWALAMDPGFALIESETTVVLPLQNEQWKAFTLANTQITSLAESLQRIGFGSLEDIYLAIIPPLRATGRLPDPNVVVDYLCKEAAEHQTARNWSEATEILSWGFRTLTVPRHDPDIQTLASKRHSTLKWGDRPTAAIKAIAAMVEFSRSLYVETAKFAQQNSASAIATKDDLENLQRRLIREMHRAESTWGVISSLRELYSKQGRTVGCMKMYPSAVYKGEARRRTPSFGHNMAHATIVSGDISELLDDIFEMNLSDQDVLGWTPLHYAAKFMDVNSVVTLVKRGGASWDVRDLAGFTPLHYLAEATEYKSREETCHDCASREGSGQYENQEDYYSPSEEFDTSQDPQGSRAMFSTPDDGLGQESGVQASQASFSRRGSTAISDVGTPPLAVDERAEIDIAPSLSKTVTRDFYPGLADESQERIESSSTPDSEPADDVANDEIHFDYPIQPLRPHRTWNELDDEFDFLFSGVTSDVDAQALDGSAPLHCAARCGNENMIRKLLAEGANPQICDTSRRTPLHLAASSNRLDIVNHLLLGGASARAVDDFGQLPIHLAAKSGSIMVAKILIEGVEINTRDKGSQTPLNLAASHGHTDLVRLLLQNGAFVNTRSRFGTPLVQAARNGHHSVVEVLWAWQKENLIEHSGSADAFVTSARGGFGSVVAMLLKKGVLAGAVSKTGETALMAAAREGQCNVATMLLSNGAEVLESNSLLEKAVAGGHVEMIRLLLDYAVDINAQDSFGNTPLHQAAMHSPLPEGATHSREDVVNLLLERGSLIETQNKTGKTAEDIALSHHNWTIAEILAQAREEIDRGDDEVDGGGEGNIRSTVEENRPVI